MARYCVVKDPNGRKGFKLQDLPCVAVVDGETLKLEDDFKQIFRETGGAVEVDEKVTDLLVEKNRIDAELMSCAQMLREKK